MGDPLQAAVAAAHALSLLWRKPLMEVNHCVARTSRCQAVASVKYPIYDQTVYLNDYHKKMLKDQYVQALQGDVCSVWPKRHPLPEHLRRPHHPLPRPAHQG
ncbi:Putative ribosomal protein S4 (RPS4A) family protein isoform 1 [Zea mays]|uniref:Putative ribosomal protein S4 (RPS4A) family protein isoform 1 n=1 Tax=Zea mays TaxID=4577 RepID=A0A1D6QNL7_MAIZE|nr:Putative ribosomal protein S4 (RPS4A) family protein isoform 1 [Zea mays]